MMSVNIANALLNFGVESYLCVTRVEGNLKCKLNSEVNYFFLNKKRSLDILAVRRLKKYIKQHKIKIVHAHSSSYFIASLVKIISSDVEIFWHDHYGNSELLSVRKKQPLVFLSKKFTAIISVNNLLKNWSKIHLKAKNVYYLPNFASLSDVSQKTNLNGIEGKKIVCVAGFRPQKDHITLLKAFQKINKKNIDWTLHLIGNQYDNQYYQSIDSFVEKNNLSKKVFIYHNSTDIKYILSQATIGVLSSISEGLPVSLLEYGLAKLPVIVTRVGECEQVLDSGKYGLLVPPLNVDELIKSIEKLIDNLDLRAEFSNKFNKHIINNYSEQNFIHKLLEIYKN